MEYTIVQTGPGVWELRAADGAVVETFTDKSDDIAYEQAIDRLRTEIVNARLAADEAGTDGEVGLLTERWGGEIAFSELLPGGRDFTSCAWSWRDPANVVVPLMLMTETTEYGHLGAELAGFVEEFTESSGTVSATGRFYDSDVGRQFRDMLSSGPPFGVSVDPTENVSYEFHEECVEEDDDGFCEAWDLKIQFTAYEIGAVTGAPVAGFENAAIALAASRSTGATGRTCPVFLNNTLAIVTTPGLRASVNAPSRPPRSWMRTPEPELGVDWIDDLVGDEVLVPQRNRAGEILGYACPVEYRDDGRVYGHVTMWERCHVADPWGPGVCASAQPSANGYADFMTGTTVCDDGVSVPTGVLTVGCEHSFAENVQGVRDHLAHAGLGFADVTVTDGQYGPWISGVLRPDVTDAQIRVLRSLSLSGEWIGELAGILAVNVPGLPVQRALAASAFTGHTIVTGALRASVRAGGVTSLVGPNIVQRCPDCDKRLRSRPPTVGNDRMQRQLDELTEIVGKIELRTRPMVEGAAELQRQRLVASRG